MIKELAAVLGSIALLPLGGCTPATSADWYIDTDKASSEADAQSVRRLLYALGYTEYDQPLEFAHASASYLHVVVRTNKDATKINVVFVEYVVRRFSPLANERVAAIDAALVQEFGPNRVKRA